MSENWLQEFESRLEQLETAAKGDAVDTVVVLQRATSAVNALVSDAEVSVLLTRASSDDAANADMAAPIQTIIADQLHADGRLKRTDSAVLDLVRETLIAGQYFQAASDGERAVQLVCTPIGQDQYCVLQAKFTSAVAGRRNLVDGLQVVSEILASVVTRHLLSQYDDRLHRQAALISLVNRLHTADSSKAAAVVIAQEGPAALGDCRISVLISRGGKPVAEAVTGIQVPNRDSEAVRAISEVAVSDDFTDWRPLDEYEGQSGQPLATLQKHGVLHLRILQIRDEGSDELIAAIVIDLQQSESVPEEYMVQQLQSVAEGRLRQLLQHERPIAQRLIRSRKTRWTIAAAAILAVLVFWPTRFEVEVKGRIVSSNHRRIFAPEHCIVDRVLFDNEQSVENNAVLLELSNADIALELRRIDGEIATTDSQLTTTRANLLTKSDPEDSGREQRLLQQLNNLEEERSLINDRAKSLMLTAPFKGRVFRHNPQQELLLRPVQRGQLLLEIVPVDEKWHLELAIPDDLEAYVRERIQSYRKAPSVRYFVRATPDHYWSTSLTTMDDAVQMIDGDMICRGTAGLGNFPVKTLRPGISVTARIDCGNRSLGFVWFREVIELWRGIQFAWF